MTNRSGAFGIAQPSAGIVRLVIGAAEVDDLGVDTPEGIIVGEVSYKGHRYPAEIIAHCVWLYHRFPLSFREVEELMLVRGVIVTYETIRQWCAKFGPDYAAGLRRRQPRPGDKWHLDEVFLTINGRRQYLWRAVDQDGNVLDGTVNLSNPRAIFAGSPPRFTRSRVTYEAYAVSRTSTRPQVDAMKGRGLRSS